MNRSPGASPEMATRVAAPILAVSMRAISLLLVRPTNVTAWAAVLKAVKVARPSVARQGLRLMLAANDRDRRFS